MRARIDDAQVARSICPYCGVGCGQLISTRTANSFRSKAVRNHQLARGNLCPKGAASYQLLTHSRRETKMKYRAPRSQEWTGDYTRSRHGDGCRPPLGIAQAHLCARAGRRFDQSHHGHMSFGVPRWTTKRIISSKSNSPEAWAGSVCPTRPIYDIAARCPAWAPLSAGVELRPRNKTRRMQIAF